MGDDEDLIKIAVKEAFDMTDTDGSGFIDLSELGGLMETLGNEAMDDDELKITMERLDTNGDGKVGFEEFYAWYTEM